MDLSRFPVNHFHGVLQTGSQLPLYVWPVIRKKYIEERLTDQLCRCITQLFASRTVDREDNTLGIHGEVHGGIEFIQDPVTFLAGLPFRYRNFPFMNFLAQLLFP